MISAASIYRELWDLYSIIQMLSVSYLLSHTSLQAVGPPVFRYWVWSACDLEALEEKLRLNVDQEIAHSGL